MSEFWNGAMVGFLAAALILTPTGRGVIGAGARTTSRAVKYGAETIERKAEKRFSIIK